MTAHTHPTLGKEHIGNFVMVHLALYCRHPLEVPFHDLRQKTFLSHDHPQAF